MQLSKVVYTKRNFNPASKKDREVAFQFLKKNSWIGVVDNNLCPFYCEWPYLNIPAMLKDRLLHYYSSK